MGIDMATYTELIAHRFDVEGIKKHIGADSLQYLSLDGMLDAICQHRSATYCTACFTGMYPISIPDWLFEDDRDKLYFEEVWGI